MVSSILTTLYDLSILQLVFTLKVLMTQRLASTDVARLQFAVQQGSFQVTIPTYALGLPKPFQMIM